MIASIERPPYYGPHSLALGDRIRHKLTGEISHITRAGIDEDGRFVHATNKEGDTRVYSERYLSNCERI